MGDINTTRTTPSKRRRHGRHGRRIAAIGVIAAVGLTACSGGDDEDAADQSAAFELDDGSAAEEPAGEAAADDRGDAATGASAPTDAADLDLGIVGRDVIIEMHVVMSSDDIGRTVASISASASQLGGGIASSSVDYGDPTAADDPDGRIDGHAVLVVKVPPDRIDRLLSGLDASGTVRSIEQSAQDVTEQLVDLDVRIANARESVSNVREFMDRATDLNQLVTLERELTTRQTELERLEAQQRNLSDRVALSTVTIEVVPTAALPEVEDADDDESLGDAVRDGWEAFTSVLFAIVYLLAVLMPFLVLAAIVGAVVWLILRRRSGQDREDHGFDEPADGEPTPVGAATGDASANRPE